jgi:hypothetical protein
VALLLRGGGRSAGVGGGQVAAEPAGEGLGFLGVEAFADLDGVGLGFGAPGGDGVVDLLDVDRGRGADVVESC